MRQLTTLFRKVRERKAGLAPHTRLHGRIRRFKTLAEETGRDLDGAVSRVDAARIRLSAKYSLPRGARDGAPSHSKALSRNFSSEKDMHYNLEILGKRAGRLQGLRNEVRRLLAPMDKLNLFKPAPPKSWMSVLSLKLCVALTLAYTAAVSTVRLCNVPNLDPSTISGEVATGAGIAVAAVAMAAVVAFAARLPVNTVRNLKSEIANDALDAFESALSRLQSETVQAIKTCTEGVDEVLAHFGSKGPGNQTQN